MDPAQLVLDSLTDAVVVASAEGLVSGWHGAAERLIGYPAEEALGRPLTFLFPGAPARDFEELATLGGAPGIDTVVPVRRRDGGAFTAAITVRPLPGGGGTVALIKPMGPWLDPRPAKGRANPEWDRVLGQVLRELIELAGTDLSAIDRTDALARVLVEQGRRIVPGTECLLSLVPHDRQQNFQIIAGAGSWAETLVGSEWPRAGTVAGETMERRRAIETVRLLERSRLRDRLARGDIHTGRLVPLWTREPLPDGRSALGVFGFYRKERAYFTPYQRRLMNEFVRLASLTLQRTELIGATARAAGRLQVGVEAAYDLASTLAPPQVVRGLIDRALAASGADRVTVLRVDGEQATVVESVDRSGEHLPVGRHHPASGLEQLARPSRGIRHSLLLPLGTGTPAVVLIVGRRRNVEFGVDDVATLRTLGNMAALALRNAWLYGQVEEAARVKTDFLNMAAHELRTPLTVVRGYLSMLREGSFGPVPPTWTPPLKILAGKAEELGHLVDDLLLAARLETGRVATAEAPVDLNALAAAAVERARPRARELGADFRFEGARRPVVVSADADHVARILDSLLANALTFARGRPWVRVRLRQADAGRTRVEIEDRGLGIAAEHAERVFERFYRVQGEAATGQAGTGLGLYIGRVLAERMGASLELERSEPGAGSLFVLSVAELARPLDD